MIAETYNFAGGNTSGRRELSLRFFKLFPPDLNFHKKHQLAKIERNLENCSKENQLFFVEFAMASVRISFPIFKNT